jgi:hypothetical protein
MQAPVEHEAVELKTDRGGLARRVSQRVRPVSAVLRRRASAPADVSAVEIPVQHESVVHKAGHEVGTLVRRVSQRARPVSAVFTNVTVVPMGAALVSPVLSH